MNEYLFRLSICLFLQSFFLRFRNIPSNPYPLRLLIYWDDNSKMGLFPYADPYPQNNTQIYWSLHNQASVYKGYKQDKIEMRGDRAEMSDFPLYLNTVAGGLDRRDQTIGGFSFVVKIYAVPVIEIIG